MQKRNGCFCDEVEIGLRLDVGRANRGWFCAWRHASPTVVGKHLTIYLLVDNIRRMEQTTVREQLLEQAITLIMLHGYNGFSYGDLSRLVGVKTSSIHYYFPSKNDLIFEAVNRYAAQVADQLRAIDAGLPADVKLSRFATMFGKTLGDGDRICLCLMLSADFSSLPNDIRQAIQAFFKTNENWLAVVLAQGADERTLRFNGPPENAARALFAAFQGSVLTSRLFGVKSRIEDVVDTVRGVH